MRKTICMEKEMEECLERSKVLQSKMSQQQVKCYQQCVLKASGLHKRL